MAVPLFFYWLLRRYNNIIIREIPKVNNLYFDANCIFHPKCYEIKSGNEKEIFENITNYFDYIIDLIKPTTAIYFAVDGPVPIAKIMQQRKRRYKSLYDHEVNANIEKQYGVKINNKVSSVVITPGTKFMQNLDAHIKEYINNLKQKYNNIEIIYSSHEEYGEGEHKIIDYIRDHYHQSHAIYGLDADLIFLSLGQISEIYLIREQEDKHLMYVSIIKLKQFINNYFNKICKTDEDFIKDFILICFFLGNDFIEHTPSIIIDHDGIEILMQTYCELFKKNKEHIINTNKINRAVLFEFLSILSEKEATMFLKEYIPKQLPKDIVEQHKIDLWKIDNMQMRTQNESTLVINNKNDMESIKRDYYQYYMRTENTSDGMIKKCCENYIESIIWTTNYYEGQCPSNKWFYRYDMAPFLTDVIKYFDSVKINFEENIEITLTLQQLIAMPYEYNEMISHKRLLELVPDLYPSKFQVDIFKKYKFYKCMPILPPILNLDDMIKIANSFNKKKNAHLIKSN